MRTDGQSLLIRTNRLINPTRLSKRLRDVPAGGVQIELNFLIGRFQLAGFFQQKSRNKKRDQ
ncbi:MAG: hypothetical protein K1Y02_23770 [Candidatus Hydrogenedentes bacterium]|nr:hypothetical protein [Candidatus Hydrogenedentota bacterium]